MRSLLPLLVVILAVVVCGAQVAIPGTFNTVSPQTTTQYTTAPLISPPVISYGADVTSPVVINRGTFVVTAPTSVSVEPSMVSRNEAATLPGMVNTGGSIASAPSPRVVRFEYVVAPNSGVYSNEPLVATGIGDRALGEVAASLRKSPAPTQRSFTNDDIARMNGVSNSNFTMPGASTQEQAYTASTAATDRGTVPTYARPSVREEPREMAQANPPASPTEPTPMRQGSEQLPATSTSLPLFAAIGMLAAAAGLVFARGRTKNFSLRSR